ncbi:MAG: GyrI-like domain-containing protein [Eubacteriales bacterium]
MNPHIFQKEALIIAGVTGDGNKTGELWENYIRLNKVIGLSNKLSDNGFEVRIYSDNECICHVGVSVSDKNVNNSYNLLELPASEYASFLVKVAKGYDSENFAMDEWLKQNKDKYNQKLYVGKPYVIEYYDERFHGNETDSVVEIWIPIEKTV